MTTTAMNDGRRVGSERRRDRVQAAVDAADRKSVV